MSFTAKDLVNTQLANSGPNPDTRPTTPEPTTPSGIEPENALYDTPEEGSQSAEFRSGRRKRRSTERGGCWTENLNRSEERRKKSNRTRKINSARRVHLQPPPSSHGDGSQGPTPTPTQPDPESQPNPEPQPNSEPQPKPGPLPQRQRRGRTRTVRHISRSPTPGSTDHEIEATQPPTLTSQFTFVYETLDHDGLIQYAQENHGVDGRGCDTHTILAKIRVAEMQQASQVGPPRQPPSIDRLPGLPLQVGGGWHRKFAASQPAEPHGTKRGLDTSKASGVPTKRQRVIPAPESDTATISETDDEWAGRPVRIAAERLLSGHPQRPDSARPSAPGAHAPPPSPGAAPPSCNSTPTALPTSQPPRSLVGIPSHSNYGKSTTPAHPVPPIPTLLSPIRGPVHARLHSKALHRYFNHADRNIEAAEDEEVVELVPTDTEEVPEMDFNTLTRSRPGPSNKASSGQSAPSTAPQRTYRGSRTHLPSQPQAAPTEPENDVPHPDSPTLTSAQLIRREHSRAVAAKAHAEAQDHLNKRQRSHLFAEASAPPIARPQARPPPGTSGDAPGTHVRGTHRVDPVGQARSDMIKFNEAVAREEATSFVQSVTRQSKRTARRPAPASRPLNGYLDDDEEDLAQAEAFAKNKWPPLARDVSGVERQILIMAKIHLFAYALVEGIYQTRATFLRWAAAVHFATWQMELPTTPYVKPPDEHFEIMVNSIATMRGKVKECVRPFTANAAGLQQRQTNQQVIQENLNKFNLLYPNNFHCRTYCPRKGHFENPEIGHCIAVALFHGPGSVGVMYPDYFADMPLTVVAFSLAIWQFCLGEWSNGWQQNGDLGMAAMRERYESLLAGLKVLRDVAPKRMSKLQTQWRNYVMEYSGAMLANSPEAENNGLWRSEMRSDTPELEVENDEAQAWAEAEVEVEAADAMSVDELNDQLFETARQASLQERLEQIAAHEEIEDYPGTLMVNNNDSDNDAQSHTSSPHSRLPSPPPVEYNSQGRLTARSKGKGRAN